MHAPTVEAIEHLVDGYCGAWNETEQMRREKMLDGVWAPDATYTDPTMHTLGARELSAHIGRVQARVPGSRIVRTSGVDSHHGLVRFSFERVMANGTLAQRR